METTPLLESTPLLSDAVMVDPPIDDESFRNESHPFPSEEQKHLIFTGYAATSVVTRFFEIMVVFLITWYYGQSLRAITFFSFMVLGACMHLEGVFQFISKRFPSRLHLTVFLILQQRLAMVIFAVTWAHTEKISENSLIYRSLRILLLTLCVVWAKAAFAFYQSTIRIDWLQVLTCSHQTLRLQFERIMSVSAIFSQLLLAVAAGYMIELFPARSCCSLIIFLAIFGFLIETSMVYKLYRTCYALYLPRGQGYKFSKTDIFEYSPMLGVLTTHFNATSIQGHSISVTRASLAIMVEYIKSKPIPVAVTVGTTMVNVSLLTLGPHMVWFFLRKEMSAPLIGVYKFFQAVMSIRPLFVDKRAFLVFVLGNLAAIILLCFADRLGLDESIWIHALAFAIIFAKSGVAGINRISDQFVASYLGDEELHSVYDENAVWVRTRLELCVHLFPFIWSHVDQFWVSTTITGITSFVGAFITCMVLVRYHR